MRLYRPGPLTWVDSQLLYHALPRVGREGLILCRPNSPYVSIGYHQDLRYEVDVGFCHEHSIPLFRREVAGGTVYLDGRQLFYQLVLHKKNPALPARRDAIFAKFLGPVMATLDELGLPARLVPPCDIQVGERKISGNGAGEIGDYVVLVGNLLLDFDCVMMSRVLNLPGRALREVVRTQMERRLSTLRRELLWPPSLEALEEALARNFARALPGLEPGEVDPEVWAKVRELERAYLAPEWLFEPGRQLPYREVKIAEGTYVYAIGRGQSGAFPLLVVTQNGRVSAVEPCEFEEGKRGCSGVWRRFIGKRLLTDRLRRLRWDATGVETAQAPQDPGRLLAAVTA